MTGLAALRKRLVAPDSHAGGDCQCACFDEGFDAGVDAALGALEPVVWTCGTCGFSRVRGQRPCCPESVITLGRYRIKSTPEQSP